MKSAKRALLTPDSDNLQADLDSCYEYNSEGELLLESKEDAKRGLPILRRTRPFGGRTM